MEALLGGWRGRPVDTSMSSDSERYRTSSGLTQISAKRDRSEPVSYQWVSVLLLYLVKLILVQSKTLKEEHKEGKR